MEHHDDDELSKTVIDVTVLADRYRVLSRLGRGGMGEVYEGHDLELDRRVALKIAPRDRVTDLVWVERFLRQARALARIDHPGVVRVYDRGLHARELPFVVMEHLVGQDLAQVLRMRGRLALEQVLDLGEQIAAGLEATHAADVIHRDLKPSNIVLLTDGKPTPRVKLVDFGISKLPAQEDLTGSRELLGTAGYIAPELLDGAFEASAASDVYALGVILFELLAGRRPFREDAQSELLRAIRVEPPPSLRTLDQQVPRALDELILRMLAKSAAARPSAVEVSLALQKMAPVDPHPWSTLAARWPTTGDVLAGRFELVRMIGEGRSGIVYEARDRQQAHHVALKVLRHHGADDVYRLKREYRTLQEIAHPNIVQIQGLYLEDAVAFLAMELLSGPPFMVMAASSPSVDGLLVQVARGLATLHARGLTHRDVKPSNIRVAADGRVVLLDFGLVVDSDSHTVVAGTPPYMAPEVLEGKITPAADMFSFGVILHELITGGVPGQRALRDAPRKYAPWLVALCERLLAPAPAARPSADEVLRALETQTVLDTTLSRASSGTVQTRPFVGREPELKLLLEHALHAASGRLQSVLVHGPSGIGKTTLVEQLLRRLPEPTLTLLGRCREAEVIPYPALDGAIDALSEHLLRLPPLVLRYLLPREVAALPLLFPVLRRVDALADSTPHGALPADPLEVRTRAFRAFKELLRRLADQHPLVLVIDDVQWIDPDSSALLTYCFSEPEPPPALLVFALRDGEGAHAEFEAFSATLAAQPQRVSVGPLSETASHQLARSLWPGEQASDDTIERLTTQSGGHPFLLTMLLEQPAAQRADATLDEALLAHVHRLPEPARRMVELVAVCQRPLPRALFLSLFDSEGPSVLHSLRRDRLLQRHEARSTTLLDVYHARVRDAVVGALDPARKRAHHAALARALASTDDYPEAYVEHLEAAGDVARAAEAAVHAAHAADEILAFERAASLYATARQLRPEGAVELLEREATSLRNAGRLRGAGHRLQEAARLASEPRLSLEAGRHLLLSGDIDAGLRALAPLLDEHGVALPRGLDEILTRGGRELELLSARGLAPAARGADAHTLQRCELLLTLAHALAHCDIRGIPLAFEALRAALDLPDTRQLQRALAVFVISTAPHMHTSLIEPALALCAQLTPGLGAYAQAMLHAAEAEHAHFTGQFLSAESSFESAERLLVESCVGATRELSTVRNGSVFMQYAHKGDFASRVPQTVEWLRDAEAREDVFHTSMLRMSHAIVWVAHDEPDRARRELVRAEADWSGADGLFEVAAVLYHDIVDRYAGRDDAHLFPCQGRRHVLEGPAVNTSFLGGYIELHRAWGSLRALARGQRSHGEQAMAERAIAKMRSLGEGIWEAVHLAFEANLLCLQRELPAALSALERSEHAFRRANMLCLAATARHRRGELSSGAFGNEIMRSAHSELRALGVAQPLKWCRAYFSPFPAEEARDMTLD
jgi:serine/threonine protein kinase/tetratricopeptide (TPR) repeat protein